ncbi:MAG: Hsp70 family protein, partial [Clostridia bacterium]|nr:Hsp70 family protein [Clostridia bacterium]
GVPQIEVTFDIDANGIVNVSAKDLGTGKSQNITITASSNLSEADINKAVNEAKQYEEEDKKRKEGVESHNKLDGMIFTVEKTIKDVGDKISEEDKAKLEEEIKTAKTELESNDKDRMDKAFENLSQASQTVFAKIYQQQAPNGGQGPQGDNGGNAGDTEFHQG